MYLYLAHPINGLTPDQVLSYYKRLIHVCRRLGYKVLHPMTGKETLRTEPKFKAVGYEDQPIATNRAIIGRDHWMVCKADVVYVNLFGAKEISIGCLMELAWAHHLHKHTIVCIEPNNIHQHAFVLEAADILFEKEQDAERYLKTLIDGTF